MQGGADVCTLVSLQPKMPFDDEHMCMMNPPTVTCTSKEYRSLPLFSASQELEVWSVRANTSSVLIRLLSGYATRCAGCQELIKQFRKDKERAQWEVCVSIQD